MAISIVGTATGTNTATPPAHQTGDLFVVFAFRDGSTTKPTIPGGYLEANGGGANTCSATVCRKYAASTSETVGTFSNATSLILFVLRGVDQSTPIGTVNLSTGASTTITYPSLAPQRTDGTSWVLCFGGHRSADVAITTLPSGMTLATSVSDATDEAVAFYLSGISGAFTSRTSAVGGTSSGWRSHSIEILAQAALPDALSALGISSSSSVDAPALGQIHSLGASNVSSSSSVGTPSIGPVSSVDDLTALGISSGSNVAAPAISQVHVLSGLGVSSASSTGRPTIAQTHGLTALGLVSGSAAGSPSIAQSHVLAASGVASSPSVGRPTLAQSHALGALGTLSGSAVARPSLGQTHGLATSGIASGSSVAAPSIGQRHALVPASVQSASTVGIPSLTSRSTRDDLVALGLSASSSVGSPTVSQTHSLEAASILAPSGVPAPSLGQIHAIYADGVAAGSFAASAPLAQTHELVAESVLAAFGPISVSLGRDVRTIMISASVPDEFTVPVFLSSEESNTSSASSEITVRIPAQAIAATVQGPITITATLS